MEPLSVLKMAKVAVTTFAQISTLEELRLGHTLFAYIELTPLDRLLAKRMITNKQRQIDA